MQIEHFTAPQKCLILNFQDVQIGRVGTKYFPKYLQRGMKITYTRDQLSVWDW